MKTVLKILSLILAILKFLCFSIPGSFIISSFLLNSIEEFYGLDQDSEIALVGHSHLMLGIDKQEIEKNLSKKVSKYTREGVNVADREIMIQQLVNKNPSLKTVIYGVDAWMFTGEGLSNNSYKLFYPFMDTPMVDDFIQTSSKLTDYLQHKFIRSSRFNSLLMNASIRGYLENWTNLKYGQVDIGKLQEEIRDGNFRKIRPLEENKKIFERTLEYLSKKNIGVVLVYVPTIDLYNAAEPEKFVTEIEYFQKLSNKRKDVEYLDYTAPLSSQHNLFYDAIHLNPIGQESFTKLFIEDLKGQ